jgi:hypothetical protein
MTTASFMLAAILFFNASIFSSVEHIHMEVKVIPLTRNSIMYFLRGVFSPFITTGVFVCVITVFKSMRRTCYLCTCLDKQGQKLTAQGEGH